MFVRGNFPERENWSGIGPEELEAAAVSWDARFGFVGGATSVLIRNHRVLQARSPISLDAGWLSGHPESSRAARAATRPTAWRGRTLLGPDSSRLARRPKSSWFFHLPLSRWGGCCIRPILPDAPPEQAVSASRQRFRKRTFVESRLGSEPATRSNIEGLASSASCRPESHEASLHSLRPRSSLDSNFCGFLAERAAHISHTKNRLLVDLALIPSIGRSHKQDSTARACTIPRWARVRFATRICTSKQDQPYIGDSFAY